MGGDAIVCTRTCMYLCVDVTYSFPVEDPVQPPVDGVWIISNKSKVRTEPGRVHHKQMLGLYHFLVAHTICNSI